MLSQRDCVLFPLPHLHKLWHKLMLTGKSTPSYIYVLYSLSNTHNNIHKINKLSNCTIYLLNDIYLDYK